MAANRTSAPSWPVPVVDTSRSPHCRLRPVPLTAVRLEDQFWAPRLRTNREVTLPGQYQQCEQTGRIDNFRRAAHPDARLEEMLNTVVTEIAAAQDADGYLNTYFTFERQPERWSNLRDLHELYCAGHLFQAAIAHHRATGQSSLLDVATRFADHIAVTF